MNTYKFLNKKESANILWMLVIVSIFSVMLISNYNIGINKSLAYFFVSLIAFIKMINHVKKTNKTFEEIIVMENSFKLCFLNKMKKPLTINKNEVEIIFNEKEIIFNNKETKKIIGMAYKMNIEESEKWSELVNSLNG